MASIGPPTHENSHLKRAFALTSAKEAEDLYDEWASKYDSDLEGMKYTLHKTAADALIAALKKIRVPIDKAKILDAGCGTGLVGSHMLKESEGKTFHMDGQDISQKMLDIASKTNAYKTLETADLSTTMKESDGSYDAIICVGTLTQGHLGPDPIDEMVRVCREVVVFTVGGGLWDSGGYSKKVDKLEWKGKVKILRSESVGVTEGSSKGAWLVVLEKISDVL